MMQFIYILKLVPRLFEDSAWTEADNDIVSEHFKRLQDLKAEGKLILAGRTTNEGENTFGIVIVNGDEQEALNLMNSDPAVAKGIMTAELFPYRVALISEENAL